MDSWVLLHEVLHKLCQVLGTFNRHSVVHRDSDTCIECMASDLNDTSFLSLRNESFFKLFVSVLNPENNVDSRSVSLVSDLGLVVSV